ncbi:MAG: hypothetical protein K6D37_03305 [Prevotella sp.]|nr:hypothetical protein [Prevotella sp.]
MKKMILTVVAMMSFTLGFADNGAEKNTETEAFWAMRNVKNYDMTCDMRRLAVKLDLTENQMDAVEVIQEIFNSDMQNAATARGFERRAMLREAVKKDAHQMKRVLNDKQFETYMMLLGTTLRNRGL